MLKKLAKSVRQYKTAVFLTLLFIVLEAVIETFIPFITADLINNIKKGVELFDIYTGTGIPEGKKSVAFSLELRADDRTLTDTDSEGVVTKVLNALKDKLNASLR